MTYACFSPSSWHTARTQGKLVVVSDNIKGVAETFLSAKASFAIVDNGEVYGKRGLVPIIPRHMSARHWRSLFAMSVRKLVIYGREHDDMCSICVNSIPCSMTMSNRSNFKCVASHKTLTVLSGRKHLGRDKLSISETG